MLKKAKEDKVYFAEKFLGIFPYDYQKEVLRSKSNYVVVLFGRQLGKTVIGIINILHTLNMFPGSSLGIIANDKNRANVIYKMVKQIQGTNPLLSRRITKSNAREFEITQKVKIKGIEFETVSNLQFFASGANSTEIRGSSLDGLMLDEVEFIASETLDAAVPTVAATGGWVFQSSTPGYHKYSKFYTLFTSAWEHKQKFKGILPLAKGEDKPTSVIFPETGYEAFHTIYRDILDVVNPVTGRPQVNMDVIRAEKFKSLDTFTREYEAKWLDKSSTFFDHQSIEDSLVPKKFNPEFKGEKIMVMGLDFARLVDYSAIVIAEVYPDEPAARIVYAFSINRVGWDEILDHVVRCVDNYNVEHIIYDPNGIGDPVSAWAKLKLNTNEHLSFQSLSFQNSRTSNLKAEAYGNLKFGISLGNIYINNDLTKLIGQLKSIVEMKSTATKDSQRLSITAPNKQHDDEADACVLACFKVSFVYNIEQSDPVLHKKENLKKFGTDYLAQRVAEVHGNKDDLIEYAPEKSANKNVVEYEDIDFEYSYENFRSEYKF